MTEEKEEETKEVIKKKGYTLVQVPTEHRIAIQTPDEKELLSTEAAIVQILHEIAEIKKGLLG